jgi:hypothetical protein
MRSKKTSAGEFGGGHIGEIEFVFNAKNVCKECYFVWDGQRIARRLNKTWVSLVRGFTVDEVGDHDETTIVTFNGKHLN